MSSVDEEIFGVVPANFFGFAETLVTDERQNKILSNILRSFEIVSSLTNLFNRILNNASKASNTKRCVSISTRIRIIIFLHPMPCKSFRKDLLSTLNGC